MFAHDHEDERYGDEHNEQVAHLNLHPKKHHRAPTAIPVQPHVYSGQYGYHSSHEEVLPEGDDHWVEVRRDHDRHTPYAIAGHIV
mmetsp:Transcript_8478/g.10416  ORF Transcript_8478/g.10416 Transcript_8478/m.10416 type:complete len:85 (+) Transcript_8478:2929-3183(+)